MSQTDPYLESSIRFRSLAMKSFLLLCAFLVILDLDQASAEVGYNMTITFSNLEW